MLTVIVAGKRYETEDQRGFCSPHHLPLFDAPLVLANLDITDQELADALAGLWGIGWCPVGKHYEVWKLPAYANRPNASDLDPYGYEANKPLDNISPM